MYVRWLEVFPREQIYVVDGDQFISSPWIELRNLETFLGLNTELSENNFYFNQTKGFYCGRREVVRDDMECVRWWSLPGFKSTLQNILFPGTNVSVPAKADQNQKCRKICCRS